jgi:hypothetical protein
VPQVVVAPSTASGPPPPWCVGGPLHSSLFEHMSRLPSVCNHHCPVVIIAVCRPECPPAVRHLLECLLCVCPGWRTPTRRCPLRHASKQWPSVRCNYPAALLWHRILRASSQIHQKRMCRAAACTSFIFRIIATRDSAGRRSVTSPWVCQKNNPAGSKQRW